MLCHAASCHHVLPNFTTCHAECLQHYTNLVGYGMQAKPFQEGVVPDVDWQTAADETERQFDPREREMLALLRDKLPDERFTSELLLAIRPALKYIGLRVPDNAPYDLQLAVDALFSAALESSWDLLKSGQQHIVMALLFQVSCTSSALAVHSVFSIMHLWSCHK
jgi:hypothetical protein